MKIAEDAALYIRRGGLQGVAVLVSADIAWATGPNPPSRKWSLSRHILAPIRCDITPEEELSERK